MLYGKGVQSSWIPFQYAFMLAANVTSFRIIPGTDRCQSPARVILINKPSISTNTKGWLYTACRQDNINQNVARPV